jgi:hypothetical protein
MMHPAAVGQDGALTPLVAAHMVHVLTGKVLVWAYRSGLTSSRLCPRIIDFSVTPCQIGADRLLCIRSGLVF